MPEKKFLSNHCKYEVAKMLQISVKTLSIYLNTMYYSDLSVLGYKKRQKKLTPKQLNYLVEKIDL